MAASQVLLTFRIFHNSHIKRLNIKQSYKK